MTNPEFHAHVLRAHSPRPAKQDKTWFTILTASAHCHCALCLGHQLCGTRARHVHAAHIHPWILSACRVNFIAETNSIERAAMNSLPGQLHMPLQGQSIPAFSLCLADSPGPMLHELSPSPGRDIHAPAASTGRATKPLDPATASQQRILPQQLRGRMSIRSRVCYDSVLQ